MRVISTGNNASDFLAQFNNKIYLSCKDKNKSMQLLESIDLKLVAEPYYNKSNNTVDIIPHRVSRQIKIETYPPDLKVIKLEGGKIDITFSDFESSDDFYEAIKKKSSPLKIIKDEFSIQRSTTLFEYISKIELDLRQGIYENRRNIYTEAPSNIRSNTPDDIISQYNLTEIMNKHLMKSSSEDFFLSQLNAAGDDNKQRIEARNSLVIDELEMPFSINEFKSFVEVRNAIMHFRVVKISDAELVVRFYEKLLQYGILQLVRRIADGKFDN